MNRAMYAVMKKDFRGIISNRRLFSELLIVPLILTIVLPSIFVVAIHFAPDDPDILKLLELLPQGSRADSLEIAVTGLILNYILPVFFLMIPIMTASRLAASSFVGEKEKHTLETLLYLLDLEAFLILGRLIVPAAGWFVILLVLSPSISLFAVTLIVKGSAYAQSVEESQQGAVFLVVPVILLVVGQFAGVMLLNVWILLGLGVLCALLAWMLLHKAVGRFTYEMLLK